VVLDPSRQDESARVARWDFTLTATQQKLQAASAARGIRLEMPWPASPPAGNQLKLYVRYETADGRRLQTERDIYITPPGQVAQRWTPRPPDRARPVNSAVANPLPPAKAPSAEAPAATIAQQPATESPQPSAGPAAPEAGDSPKLLAPPPALNNQPAGKLSAPVWSPNR
jgi:hypothetical protein